jgi:type VI secretion system secreted protein VgrG
MEAEEAAHHAVRGASNYPCLDAGGKFSLLSHPCKEDGKQYVIRSVRHKATNTSYLSDDGKPSRYENSFEAIPHEVPFRPQRRTEKPFVHGPQTAIACSFIGIATASMTTRARAGSVSRSCGQVAAGAA